MKMHFPRLGIIKDSSICCVLASLMAVAQFFGRPFTDKHYQQLYDLTLDLRGLDDDCFGEYLEPAGIEAEKRLNATIADIKEALKLNIPTAVGYQFYPRGKENDPDYPFHQNHTALVCGSNDKYIYLEHAAYRFGQVPQRISIETFTRNWWMAASRDSFDNFLDDPATNSYGTMTTFSCKDPLPAKWESVWQDVHANNRKYAAEEAAEIKRREEEAANDVDLRTIEITPDMLEQLNQKEP